MKLYKNTLLIGTATLILAGLLTRLLGFYYRIFLSARIGAEGIGLYQMIFPLYILAMSISSSGTQLAICQLVSKDVISSDTYSPMRTIKKVAPGMVPPAQ